MKNKIKEFFKAFWGEIAAPEIKPPEEPHFWDTRGSVTDEEYEEILKHKWIESEKAGRDIGMYNAYADWVENYRDGWLKNSNNNK